MLRVKGDHHPPPARPRRPGSGLVCQRARDRHAARTARLRMEGSLVQKRFTQHIQTFKYLGKTSLWENLLVMKGKCTQRGKGNGSRELFRIIYVMP